MKIQEIAAFSNGSEGGNLAGVVICDHLPTVEAMRQLAREVGHSETVFSAPQNGGWRTRYFSPDAEIPFCGHATIALGAALASERGPGQFRLNINAGTVPVDGFQLQAGWGASFQSPPTRHKQVPPENLKKAIDGLGLRETDLDPSIPPARIHAGSDHLLIPLRDRLLLSAMHYEFEPFQSLMRRQGWVTVALCFVESRCVVHARNAFAYGGVYEDPATGAAAAALGGYLRDIGRGTGEFVVRQGDDMGVPCRIVVQAEGGTHLPVRVSGSTRTTTRRRCAAYPAPPPNR